MEMYAFWPVQLIGFPRASACGVLIAQTSQASRWGWVRVLVQRCTSVPKKLVMTCANADPGFTGMARRRMYCPKRLRL